MGYRLREETEYRPKPMVLIGGYPVLWHIMKIYATAGHNEFVLTLGYKGDMIKDYFANYHLLVNDFTYRMKTKAVKYHSEQRQDDNFTITFADTGEDSDTGKRILAVKKYITEDEFMVTYGDGVADLDIRRLLDFHRQQKKIGTITGVHPYSKYGLITSDVEGVSVKNFRQKPLMSEYVNGGFMIFNKKAFEYFDEGPMEDGLKRMAKAGELALFKHNGFWKSMDTYRDMMEINKLWNKKRPWAIWEDYGKFL